MLQGNNFAEKTMLPVQRGNEFHILTCAQTKTDFTPDIELQLFFKRFQDEGAGGLSKFRAVIIVMICLLVS